jgi:hypothetical protein
MRNATRRKSRGKVANGNRIVVLLTAMLVAVGLTALTMSAVAGADSGATVAKKKKKTCPAGTHKVVIKKHGKKKKRCVPNGTNQGNGGTGGSSQTAALRISPASFTFPATQHGQVAPCALCPTQAFTVTNGGGAASGIPAASITEIHNPEIGGPPGYFITANTCTAAIAPGGSCSVTVQFRPNSNAGDEIYTSALHVIGTPGGDAAAQMTGMSN